MTHNKTHVCYKNKLSQAVILVGGKGTRLGPLTRDTPKPLIKIHQDKVFLDYLLCKVAKYGFNEILLLAGHFANQFYEKYEGTKIMDAPIKIISEAQALGTGGALLNAYDYLSETFAFFNGDTFFNIDYSPLYEDLMIDNSAFGIIALTTVNNPSRYGSIMLDNGKIVKFAEKSRLESKKTCLVNSGVSILRKQVLSLQDKDVFSIENELFPELAINGLLLGRAFDDYFIDIGLPTTLEKAKLELPNLINIEHECDVS